jgi:hypothetical protein
MGLRTLAAGIAFGGLRGARIRLPGFCYLDGIMSTAIPLDPSYPRNSVSTAGEGRQLTVTVIDAHSIPPRWIPSRWDHELHDAMALKIGQAAQIEGAGHMAANQLRAVIQSRRLPLRAIKRGPAIFLERLAMAPVNASRSAASRKKKKAGKYGR